MPELIDSSVWIDYFNGQITPQTDYLHKNLGETEFITGDLILAEVLQGFQTERDLRAAKKALLSFPCYNMVGKDIAVKSAANYRRLRSMGFTVRKTIDCLIATFCIESQVALLHSDRNFDVFEKHLGLLTAKL